MVLLLLFFLLSIIFSFLCSIWEAVLLSITPSFIRKLKANNDPITETIEDFKDNIDRPLSAILTLNTIAHTVGAIGVGAQAGNVFGEHQLNLGPIHLSYEALIAGLMTLAILILSEIIPKTIGANNWQGLTKFTVKSIKFLLFILYPLVWVSEFITSRLKKNKEMSVFSRSDFAAMIQEGEVSGAIDQSESKIIKNLIKLNKLSVRDIMTPRTVVMMATEDQTVEAFYKANKPLRFSRIPVFQSKPDELEGVVLKNDILLKLAEDEHGALLKDIKKDIKIVKDSISLDNLMDVLASSNSHLSGVMDENGVLVGVVSLEDLFETILGMEIVDETDSVEDLQKLARTQWEERSKKLGLG